MQFSKGLETDLSELEDCTKQQVVKLVLKSILLAMMARILFSFQLLRITVCLLLI